MFNKCFKTVVDFIILSLHFKRIIENSFSFSNSLCLDIKSFYNQGIRNDVRNEVRQNIYVNIRAEEISRIVGNTLRGLVFKRIRRFIRCFGRKMALKYCGNVSTISDI